MRSLYLILLLASLASCRETEKERIGRLATEWDGKEISFPSRSVFTIQGRDTVDFTFAGAAHKVVAYVDSVGCTSCKLHLPRWKEFMSEVDSLTGGKVSFVFYFHPKEMFIAPSSRQKCQMLFWPMWKRWLTQKIRRVRMPDIAREVTENVGITT